MHQVRLVLVLKDAKLRESVAMRASDVATLTENIAEADVIAADAPVDANAFVLRSDLVPADVLPELVHDACAAIARANVRRRDMLALVVHDLRTPLGTITANLTHALGHTDGEVHEALTDASDSIAQVVRQVDNLLFVAEAGVNAPRVTIEEIDATKLFDALVDEHKASAQMRRMSLLSISNEHARIRGDGKLLMRGLSALLDVALKYWDAEKSIEIGLASPSTLFVRHDARTLEVQTPLARWLSGKRRPSEVGVPLAVAAIVANAHEGTLVLKSSARWPTELCIELPQR